MVGAPGLGLGFRLKGMGSIGGKVGSLGPIGFRVFGGSGSGFIWFGVYRA